MAVAVADVEAAEAQRPRAQQGDIHSSSVERQRRSGQAAHRSTTRPGLALPFGSVACAPSRLSVGASSRVLCRFCTTTNVMGGLYPAGARGSSTPSPCSW